MTLKFNKSHSTVKPELLDTASSKTTVYIRQNVVELEHTDELSGETYTYYEYDEAKLTKEEYRQYLDEMTATDTLETIEILKAENQSLTEHVDMLTSCLIEMSEIVYA